MFVLLLMLVGMGSAQGGQYEYEDVMKQLNRMRKYINELEGLVKSQQKEINKLKNVHDEVKSEEVASKLSEPNTTPDALETRLTSFKDELMETLTGSQSPLEITGFFDVTLEDMDEGTQGSERDMPFAYGAFELGLEYSYGYQYAVSF